MFGYSLAPDGSLPRRSLSFAAASRLTGLVSLDRDLIDCFCAHEPRAEVTKEQPE